MLPNGSTRVRKAALGLLIAGSLLVARNAQAAVFQIFLDLDNNPSTGCLATGAIGGFEQRLNTTVDESAAQVSVVTFDTCVSGVFTNNTPVAPILPPWPIGVDLPVPGLNVIETYLASAQLALTDPPVIRVLAVGSDGSQVVDIAGPVVVVLAQILEIPTLGQFQLLILATLLIGAALLVLRRGGAPVLALLLLLGGATAAWAAITLDGNPADWTAADQRATDPVDGPPGADIEALFVKEDICNGTTPCLAFRMDAHLVLNQAPVANDDTATVSEDPPGAVQIDVRLNDTDLEGDPFTVLLVSDPANGTAAVTNGGADVSYLPDLNYCNSQAGGTPDTFTYTLTPGGDTATVSVTVTCTNDPPSITSSATPSVPEGQTSVIDVQSTDPDGDTEGAGLTYSITGGADSALFTIAPATGLLTFITAPDFEAPADAGANNVYDVQVTVTDSTLLTGLQNLQVTVTNLTPEPPVITSPATVSVPENQTAVMDVQSTDQDGDTEGSGLSYAITGGADALLFSIVPATGILTFNSAPDFEAPADAGANNVYDVQVTVTDSGAQSSLQNIQVTVTDVDEDPTITSSASVSVPENQTAVIDVQATDPEGDTEGAGLTYSITGGADAALFSIVPATGVLTFNSAPDFETPGDAGGNNVYDVQVTVADSGANTDVQDLQVTVTNAGEPPVITTSATMSIAENLTFVINIESTDVDGDTEGSGLTYSITGGADSALFSVVPSTGVLSFNSAPDFEAPGDSGANNVYDVQVTVTDSTALTDVQDLQITVTNVNEAPVITSSATPSVSENQTAVIDVQATDPEGDTEGAGLSYSITGGADSALFSIVPATGVLTFNAPPDFENPGDAGANNVYDVQVTVTDSGAQTGVQNLQVTVTDGTEPPTITTPTAISVAENQTAVQDVNATDPDGDTEGAGLTYSITGGADAALFSIVPATGVLTFNSAPNFEAPGDAGANNIYDVQVTVTDSGAQTDVENLQVTVTNVNEAPSITSSATPSVPENQTAVIDVQSTDPDGETEGAGLTYSITGGADAALFSIVPGTGVLTFNSAPNFEAPGDAGANNVYDVQVTVTDAGTLTGVQNLQVTVTDAAEPPSITSSATANVPENTTGVIDVQSTDPDGDTEGAGLTYSLTGGADIALFSIVPATGVLTFNSAPNFEVPGDVGANNVYEVQVTVTDSGAQTGLQNLQVTVTNVNEAPVITSSATPSVNENQTAVIDVQSTDPDGTLEGAGGLTYAITGGADAALFSIVSTTGVLTFNSAPNFEAPGDVGANNVYDVQVTVSDPGLLTAVQNLQVAVLNVPEVPIVVNDSFDTIGNTLLQVGPTNNAPGPNVFFNGNLLSNDTNPEAPPMTAALVPGSATAGSIAVVNSDGSFTFTPVVNSAAAQSFQYTASNASGASLPATVTINIQQMAWYVKNDFGVGGTGRSSDPFDTLVEAQTISAANHWIFVHFGDGDNTGQDAGIVLKAGQHLIGEHAGFSVAITSGTFNGVAAPTTVNLLAASTGNRPIISRAGGNIAVSATDVIPAEIIGLRLLGLGNGSNGIDWTTTAAFAGTGTLSILDNVVVGTGNGGEGVDINLAGTGQTRLAFSLNALAAGGTALDIQETGTGALTILSFQSNTVGGATGGSGIVVNNAIFDADLVAGGFQTVIGGTTTIGALGNGVGVSGMSLTGVSGELTFTDLDIFADAGGALGLGGTAAFNGPAGTGTRFAVTAGTATFQATGGPMVSASNATLDLQLAISSATNSSTTGVSLTSIADGISPATNAIFSAPSGSSITTAAGAAGPAFNVSGGNAVITYAGSITNNSTAARAVSLGTWSGDDTDDAITLSGAIDENGAGILVNGTGGTCNADADGCPITFSGGMDIDTTAGGGFAATTNGGSVRLHITGTNDITSVSATALRVTGTTIGNSNLNFRNISSGNNTAAADPANGIVLSNTGALGGLIVAGNGGACVELSATCTGGWIQNMTGGDDSGATPVGTGIVLNNTANVSLTRMRINDTSNYGIRGTSVAGFTFANSVIDGVNGTNVATPFNDGSMVFFGVTGTSSGMTGTSSINNSTIRGGFQRNVAIDNSVGTLNLTVNANTIKRTSDAFGDDGFFLEADTSANVTVAITNNVFARHGGDHINLDTVNNAVMQATITGNTLHGNYAGTPEGNHPIGLGQGMLLFGASHNGTFNYDVSNNVINGNAQGGSIHVNKGSGTAAFNGRIQGNVIGTAGVTGSGSSQAFGIIIGSRGAGGSHTTLINNNQIRQYFDRGIVLQAGEGSAALNATVTNNLVDQFADAVNSLHGIHSDNGILAADTNSVCMDIRANSVANAGNEPAGGADIRLRKGPQAGLSVRIPGLVGTTSTDADNKITADNPTATTVTVTGAGFTGGAACTQPSFP